MSRNGSKNNGEARTRGPPAPSALGNPHPIHRPKGQLFSGETAWFAKSCDDSLRQAFTDNGGMVTEDAYHADINWRFADEDNDPTVNEIWEYRPGDIVFKTSLLKACVYHQSKNINPKPHVLRKSAPQESNPSGTKMKILTLKPGVADAIVPDLSPHKRPRADFAKAAPRPEKRPVVDPPNEHVVSLARILQRQEVTNQTDSDSYVTPLYPAAAPARPVDQNVAEMHRVLQRKKAPIRPIEISPTPLHHNASPEPVDAAATQVDDNVLLFARARLRHGITEDLDDMDLSPNPSHAGDDDAPLARNSPPPPLAASRSIASREPQNSSRQSQQRQKPSEPSLFGHKRKRDEEMKRNFASVTSLPTSTVLSNNNHNGNGSTHNNRHRPAEPAAPAAVDRVTAPPPAKRHKIAPIYSMSDHGQDDDAESVEDVSEELLDVHFMDQRRQVPKAPKPSAPPARMPPVAPQPTKTRIAPAATRKLISQTLNPRSVPNSRHRRNGMVVDDGFEEEDENGDIEDFFPAPPQQMPQRQKPRVEQPAPYVKEKFGDVTRQKLDALKSRPPVQDDIARPLQMEVKQHHMNGNHIQGATDALEGQADQPSGEVSERDKYEQFPGIHWLHDVTFRPPVHQLESLPHMLRTGQARYA